MAKGTDVVAVEDAATVVGYSEAEFAQYETVTVHTEAADQLVFETPGDVYIGIYAGHALIYPDPEKEPGNFFVQLRWTDPEGAKFTNAGYELRNTFTSTTYDSEGRPEVKDVIEPGTLTRVELRKFVNVDQPTDMKSFRVDAAKSRNAGNSA